MSPLPQFEQINLRKCKVGDAISQKTPIESVTMVAGCTCTGARYLGSGVKEYIIYGYGMGRLGVGANESDWGTAFVDGKTYSVMKSEIQA
jgi:hypothetical protein